MEDKKKVSPEERANEYVRTLVKVVESTETARKGAGVELRSYISKFQQNSELTREFHSLANALDAFFMDNDEFRHAYNRSVVRSGMSEAQVGYGKVLSKVSKEAYNRYEKQEKRLMLTSDTPGAGNTVDNTIAQSILSNTKTSKKAKMIAAAVLQKVQMGRDGDDSENLH